VALGLQQVSAYIIHVACELSPTQGTALVATVVATCQQTPVGGEVWGGGLRGSDLARECGLGMRLIMWCKGWRRREKSSAFCKGRARWWRSTVSVCWTCGIRIRRSIRPRGGRWR